MRQKITYYRNYKKVCEENFLRDLENFLSVINKGAPLKKKFIKGSQTPFMNRKTQK